MKEGTVEREESRDGEKDKNSQALPRTVCSPPSSSLPPPFLLSSGEGSLGEIQTLQECYHCIALAAFPSSFNRLQTPLLHGRLCFFHSSSMCVWSALTNSCLSVYLVHFCVFKHFSIYFCIFLSAIKPLRSLNLKWISANKKH